MNKKVPFIVILLFLSFNNVMLAQTEIGSDGDTIVFNPVFVKKQFKFHSEEERRYFEWFRKKTYKAYPYALIAQEKIDSVDHALVHIKSSVKQKKYIKERQDYLESVFEEQLKKLTTTEGRILIKLIYRQTGKTVKSHLKEKKGWFKTMFYSATAYFFNLNLDDEYHPESVSEDYMIEVILQHAFSYGVLMYSKDRIGIDHEKLHNQILKFEKYKK